MLLFMCEAHSILWEPIIVSLPRDTDTMITILKDKGTNNCCAVIKAKQKIMHVSLPWSPEGIP